MNKFRANLHPSFFDETKEKAGETAVEQTPEGKVVQETKEELTDFQANIAGDVASKMSSRYADPEKRKADRERFTSRIQAENNGVKYGQIWSEKIGKGFKKLCAILEEKGYINEENKQEKIASIKEQYLKEVHSQYEKYVWSADNKQFNAEKDTLFGENSRNYPANVIYKKLTGAATILDDAQVKRSKISTYDVTPNGDQDAGKGLEILNQDTKDRIDFFAHDLPNYLWQVKDKTVFQKIGGFLPLIRVSVDKASLDDKKQIENFIKLTDKLNDDKGGQKLELVLLDIFKELKANSTDKDLEEALAAHDVSLKKPKYFKNFKKAFEFYVNTQKVETALRSQHALYINILTIIQNEGGFGSAMAKFQKEVNEYQANESKEGKDYKKGKILEEDLKNLAENLGIQNFTSATRLSEKLKEYFEKTDVVDILADLNNDGSLNFADKGLTKTGLQFKAIYNIIGEDIALKNILDLAKLKNNTLGDAKLNDSEFTKDEIKNGNKKLILLLQNIISNPGVDLNVLMTYGADASERYSDSIKLLEEAESKKNKAADKLLQGIDLSKIDVSEFKDAEVANAEGLHQAVAGALYTEYSRGVGLGGRIKFEDWVKGLSLNGGIQISDKGPSLGLNLGYNHEFDLKGGWSLNTGASVGFIPMIKFGEGFVNPSWSGSGGVELAKKWIDNNAIQQKIGLRGSFTEVFGVAHVYSAFLGWRSDRLKGIEGSRKEIESKFKDKIVSPLIENIGKEFNDTEFDLTKEENVNKVRELIRSQVDALYAGKDDVLNQTEDKNLMVENTIRYLENYNKSQVQKEFVRKQIVNEMSKNYSYAWAEANKDKIDGKTELSDARIGASWVQAGCFGALVVHAGVGVTTYENDIYGDANINQYTVETKDEFKEKAEWDQEMLDYFNKYMPEGSKFSFKEVREGESKKKYIEIPAKALQDCDIKINPEMKGLIKKSETGNVLLSTQTVMDMPTRFIGAARTSTEVVIGGGDKTKAIDLRSVLNDNSWFAEKEIDESKLSGKEAIKFTLDKLNSELNKLKEKNKTELALQDYEFDEAILSKLEQGKKYVITLANTKEGIQCSVQEVKDGETLSLKYKPLPIDIMSETVQNIADKVYKEALKVTTNRLYAISHDIRNTQGEIVQHKWREYVDFANAVKEQNYSKAKEILLGKDGKNSMLQKMDKNIGEGVNFSSIAETLNTITDEAELGQAMLSINNIFARVSSVHGGNDGEYHFKAYRNGEMVDRSMGDVILGRSKEIKRKIEKSGLDDSTKKAYQNLVDFAEEDRKNNPDRYSDTSKKGKVYEGAIGINLGNAISLENPLFNPEIYESPAIDSGDLNFDGKDALQEHLMKDVVVNNKSLLKPILSALKLDGNKISVLDYNKESGKITLDIDGKNVILGADMKFGYFAQCVNHMLLLDNITAEIPGEGVSVSFNSSVIRNGEVKESTAVDIMGKVRKGIDLSATIYTEDTTKKEEPPQEPEDNPRSKPSDGDQNGQWSKPSDGPDNTDNPDTPSDPVESNPVSTEKPVDPDPEVDPDSTEESVNQNNDTWDEGPKDNGPAGNDEDGL